MSALSHSRRSGIDCGSPCPPILDRRPRFLMTLFALRTHPGVLDTFRDPNDHPLLLGLSLEDAVAAKGPFWRRSGANPLWFWCIALLSLDRGLTFSLVSL